LDSVIDGNGLLLVARLDNPTATPIEDTVRFALDLMVEPIATCQLQAPAGSTATCSATVSADGWAWQDHQRVQQRTLSATLGLSPLTASTRVAVWPKPVVLVHGTNSGAWAWQAWTDVGGFLAAQGLQGFAVGDGQFGIEPMNIGDFDEPRRPTNTIAENAAILARYVEAVRQATGAERVDLVGHSMGGLISRYYIATLMPIVERPGLPPVPAVNQLYMIGTPNAGSTCAIVPAALGLYAPASTQMTPSYAQHIFNREINDPRSVPFFMLAGDPIRDYTALVCTVVPTDVYVSVASAASAIPVMATQIPVLHGKQTQSPEVFDAVFRSLSRGPDEYPIPLPTGPAPSPEDADSLQIAALHSGTLTPDKPITLAVDVDQAPAVSFVLYAPGEDVDMAIITSHDREIRPDTAPKLPDVTLRKEDDPSTPVTKGFRITRPETGRWEVQLTPTAKLPKEGSLWAVAVFVESDLRLMAEARPAVAQAGEAVTWRAVLTGPTDTTSTQVSAVIRDVRGQVVGEATLLDDGAHQDDEAGDGVFGGTWTAQTAGLYTVAITAAGQRTNGDAFQRVAVIAVQAN
jgi:pimeloyl-ACP methyl ester carboxylesterase